MNSDHMSDQHEARGTADESPGYAQTPSASLSCTESGPDTADALCPLHVAMQGIAQSAVSQLVYYAQGEYVPRTELLQELERWQQLHQLIATRICPSSRTETATAAAVTMACALIPEGHYTSQRNLIRRCADCSRGDSCPLEHEAELPLFNVSAKAFPN
jgi:hypothetical protein